MHFEGCRGKCIQITGKIFLFKLSVQIIGYPKQNYMDAKYVIVLMFAGSYPIANGVCKWNLATTDITSQAVSWSTPGDRTSIWD
jgi:hypothetical protein